MYCIYRITNKLNGKTYIGQHKYKDLSEDTYMGSGKYLWRAIEKYGIENFEREILISEIKTKEEINKLEIDYIKLERDNGHSEYNIKDGGVGGWLVLSGENHYLYGKHLPEETRKKMSESHKGVSLSEETKMKISKSISGENHPMYDKHHSEESKKKISEAHKGKHISDEIKLKMSESHKRKNLSEDTLRKMSEATSGENNPFYGKHHTENTRKKMSEFVKISRLGKKHYNNGIECHMYVPGEEPEGYILGRLRRSI